MKKKLFSLLALCLPALAMAAPEEIQVYLNEFADVGGWGLDFHTNYVASVQSGAITNNRKMLRVTPELSYGITKNWEVAGYWLTSKGPDQANNSALSDGVKARVKWRPDASVDADKNGSPLYWAVNVEIGKVNPRLNADQRAGQLKWIGVYKQSNWTLGANLNFDRALTAGGGAAQGTTRELDTKLAYRIGGTAQSPVQLGLESYSYLGAMTGLLAGQNKNRMTFAVADFALGEWDFNVGVGRASGVIDDKLVLKVIVGVPF